MLKEMLFWNALMGSSGGGGDSEVSTALVKFIIDYKANLLLPSLNYQEGYLYVDYITGASGTFTESVALYKQYALVEVNSDVNINVELVGDAEIFESSNQHYVVGVWGDCEIKISPVAT